VRLLMSLTIAAATMLGIAASPTAEDQPQQSQPRIVIRTGDSLCGTELDLTEKAALIETPYSGRVEIDRRAVAGIVFGSSRPEDVLAAAAESDVVQLKSGDKISGEVARTDDGTVVIKAFYAGGQESRIELDTVEFVAFARPGDDERYELETDPVRVILTNGDVVGGTLASFKRDVFRLETQYAGALNLKLADVQSVHNVETSRQFYPGGPADAFVELLEHSGWLEREPGKLFLSLIRGLLNRGDAEGAIRLLDRMARYDIQSWTYQEIAGAFARAKQPDAALICYERMYELRDRNPYIYRQLHDAYIASGRYEKAAEIYEQLLNEPDKQQAGYGLAEPQLRLALAKIYNKIEDHEKAIDHLRRVVGATGVDQDTRTEAREMLVSTFGQVGQLDELLDKYCAEAEELDDKLGRDHLDLVRRYVEAGKFAKARIEIEELERLGLDEHVATAQALVNPEHEPLDDETDTEDEGED
jgi:pentatricopeptide repeat protein